MPNVPKIVHERLKVPVSAVDDHPEANLLGAFSERTLPESERAAVLGHLSRCAECREIVALALPESEAADQLPKYPEMPWFAWPTLRWGFITAGLAAVTLFGVLQYQRHSASEMATDRSPLTPATEARNESERIPAAQAAQQEAKESGTVRDKVQPEADTRTSNATAGRAPERLIRRDQAPAMADLAKSGASAYSVRTLSHGPMLANQQQIGTPQQQNANQSANVAQAPSPSPLANSLDSKQKQNAAAKPVAPAAMEANSEMVQVEARSTAPPVVAGENVNGLMVKDEPLPPPSPQSGQDETKIDRAKPAFSGAGLKSLPDSDAFQLQGRSKALLAGNLRWTINSAGGLQRSFDQGTTWQDVNVNDSYGYGGAAGFEVASTSARTKDSGKTDRKLADKKASAPPVFRTVAANGPDVWAGGSAGLLFHSLDAGAHWARIAPSSSGAVLTGDIVSMEFPDTQHGRISTSTGETWTTTDSGQTWQKQ